MHRLLNVYRYQGGHLGRVYFVKGQNGAPASAVKIVNPDLRGRLSRKRMKGVAQSFMAEGRFLADLHTGEGRPKIVQCFGFETCLREDGKEVLGISLEALLGTTGADFLDKFGRFEAIFALKIIRDVAEALEQVHARGKLHGDIKPENIMVLGGSVCREWFNFI